MIPLGELPRTFKFTIGMPIFLKKNVDKYKDWFDFDKQIKKLILKI